MFGNHICFVNQHLLLIIMKTEPTSTIERFITTQSTFKRNKKLLNIKRMNTLEFEEQIQRRTPQFSSDRNIESKIELSFMDSTQAHSSKVDKDIHRFKERIRTPGPQIYKQTISEAQFLNKIQDVASLYKESNNPKVKSGVSMQKMISREQINTMKIKQTEDERQFNNFRQTTTNFQHVPDFDKYHSRPSSVRHQQRSEQCSLKIQKAYSKFYHRSLPGKCLFNYASQKKENGKVYFFQKKPEDCPEEIDRKQVLKALQTTEKRSPSADFYRFSGREQPSNFDRCYLKPPQNFYLYANNNLKERDIIRDFQFKRVKADLLSHRISEIRKKKQVKKFKHNQTCDIKYFRLSDKQRQKYQ